MSEINLQSVLQKFISRFHEIQPINSDELEKFKNSIARKLNELLPELNFENNTFKIAQSAYYVLNIPDEDNENKKNEKQTNWIIKNKRVLENELNKELETAKMDSWKWKILSWMEKENNYLYEKKWTIVNINLTRKN